MTQGKPDEFFYDTFAEIYDFQYLGPRSDIDFYVEEARKAQGPVLEIACGTGRVAIPIAREKIEITGIDASSRMLDKAREKLEREGELKEYLTLLHADMRDFSIEEKFGLIIIPFRSFLHMLTVEDQKKALANIRNHLADDGQFILNFFNPDLNMIASQSPRSPQNRIRRTGTFTDERTGNLVYAWETGSHDAHGQIIDVLNTYEEVDKEGVVIKRYHKQIKLRWIYRYEMQHLLELIGFKIEALYGWFDRREFDRDSREMIWVAKKRKE
jgi:ubiquinone/menaquinone biosynthesis C-methylase UbiE